MIDPIILWCWEHRSADIRIRQRGSLACPEYRPDDRCVIAQAIVIPMPPDRSNP